MSTREDSSEARFQCRHILADGRRCRAACLRHEEFCYYHHASRKPVPKPDLDARKSRRAAFTMPRIEDRASIQAAVNDIIARIAANDIDPRRAGRPETVHRLQAVADPISFSSFDEPGSRRRRRLHRHQPGSQRQRRVLYQPWAQPKVTVPPRN